MKNLFTISLAILLGGGAIAQIDASEEALRKKTVGATDSTKVWTKGGVVSLGFGQAHLQNWAAGGLNSINFTGLLSLYANRTKGKLAWDNSLDLDYGAIRQYSGGNFDVAPWIKNSDRFELNSKLGRAAFGDWYYALLLNFRTQMTQGFGADGGVISNAFAPAYTTLALGMDYRPNDNFSVYISPATYRMLYVDIADLRSSFGIPNVKAPNGVDDLLDTDGNVIPGAARQDQFGAYLKMKYTKDKPFGIENVNFQTDLALFSNYLEAPQNIDVYWNCLIGMKVNKYITATIGTNLIYDHDIVIQTREDDGNGGFKKGPRTQFKEALTIGLSYKF